MIIDYRGANKIKEPIDRSMLFTVYAEKYPLTQLVDAIEIWSAFPCGEGGEAVMIKSNIEVTFK